MTDFRQKDQSERVGARTGPDGQPLSISNWTKWLQKRESFDNPGRPSGTPLAVRTIRNLHSPAVAGPAVRGRVASAPGGI